MRIRDHWNRIVRKSASSTSTSSSGRSSDADTGPPDTATTTTTTNTTNTGRHTYAAAVAAAAATLSTPPSQPWRRPSLDKKAHGSSSRLSTRITSWRSNIISTVGGGGGGGAGHTRMFPDAADADAAAAAMRRSMLRRPRTRHPSERRLTEQNMRHQEMLGTFTMKFGRSGGGEDGDGCGRSSFSGVSPGSSRPGSLDRRRTRSSSAVGPRECGRIAEEDGS